MISVSPISDRRGVLSAVSGLVIALSLFAAVLLAWPYQLFPAMPPGIASLRSLDDRLLFVAMSMLIMALAAAGQWDALVLDADLLVTLLMISACLRWFDG